MWTHADLDMTEQDRKNAMNHTELIYNYSLENLFDPFATFSIVYHESRFRELKDINTASCGAFQIAHAYVPQECNDLKNFRISLEVAFQYHITDYMLANKYQFSEKQDLFNKAYKDKPKLKNIFRLYASGPNCQDKNMECYRKAEEKAESRYKTRDKLHKIFLELYKNNSSFYHLMDNKKCTN